MTVGGRERRVGRRLVARLPVPDVVVLLVRAAVGAEDERVRLERLVRVDDDRQRLVVDEDGGDAVGGGVADVAMTAATSWAWYMTVSVGQHHLHVAGERRHPVELVALSRSLPVTTAATPGILSASVASMHLIVAWAYGLRTMSSQSWPGRLTSSMYSPCAADEARVFLALDRVAHAPDFGAWSARWRLRSSCRHSRSAGRGRFGRDFLASIVAAATTGADSASRSVPAACWIALTMFT